MKSEPTSTKNPLGDRVKLKNFQHSEFASEGTPCFQASVYIDGKRCGVADNTGRGGANRYDPHELKDQLTAVAATLPLMEPFTPGGEALPHCDETLLFSLVNAELVRRKIASMTRDKTYFRKPGTDYASGKWTWIKAKPNAACIEVLVAKHGQDVIILGHNHHDLT